MRLTFCPRPDCCTRYGDMAFIRHADAIRAAARRALASGHRHIVRRRDVGYGLRWLVQEIR